MPNGRPQERTQHYRGWWSALRLARPPRDARQHRIRGQTVRRRLSLGRRAGVIGKRPGFPAGVALRASACRVASSSVRLWQPGGIGSLGYQMGVILGLAQPDRRIGVVYDGKLILGGGLA